jgi:hypothetical protein
VALALAPEVSLDEQFGPAVGLERSVVQQPGVVVILVRELRRDDPWPVGDVVSELVGDRRVVGPFDDATNVAAAWGVLLASPHTLPSRSLGSIQVATARYS